MVTWYWSADSLIWQVSIGHNMMSYIKKVHSKPGLHVSANYGRHIARLHRRRHRHHRRRAYAPTRNTAGHDNMRRSIHVFPLVSYMGMGHAWRPELRCNSVFEKIKSEVLRGDQNTTKTKLF